MPPSPSTANATPAAGNGSSATKAIQVRSYHPDDHETVLRLFKDGMLHYATEEMRELFLQVINEEVEKDLADIEGVYKAPGGNFWVATAMEGEVEVVVGMVGLERKEDSIGELRRMSVSSAYRRYGVGRLLVSTLEEWAAESGFSKVWLGTGSHMIQAQKFYASIGYKYLKTVPIPELPGYSGQLFEKELLL